MSWWLLLVKSVQCSVSFLRQQVTLFVASSHIKYKQEGNTEELKLETDVLYSGQMISSFKTCRWYKIVFTKLLFFLKAATAVRMQPHGLRHWAGRRHGLHRPREHPGHPATEHPSAGSCGAGLPGRRAGVHRHLSEICQEVRLHLQTVQFYGTEEGCLPLNLTYVLHTFLVMSCGV